MKDLGTQRQSDHATVLTQDGMPPCDISLFVHFSSRLDVDTDKLPGKARAVLAYVALNSARPCQRDAVAGMIWAGRGEVQARQSLAQVLSGLRRSFAGSVVAGDLAASPAGLLRLPNVVTDVARFEALGGSQKPADWQLAMSLYGGPLLEGFGEISESFDDWLRAERARLHELAVLVMSKLARYQIDTGDAASAIMVCRRFLALDPLCEETHRLLMQAYLRVGRQSDALRQFQACEDILRRELGVRPDQITQSLAASIRSAAVSHAEDVNPSATGANRTLGDEAPFVGQSVDSRITTFVSAISAAAAQPASPVRPGFLERIGRARFAAVALLLLTAGVGALAAYAFTRQTAAPGSRYRTGEIIAATGSESLRFISHRLNERLAEGLSGIPFVELVPRGSTGDWRSSHYLIAGSVQPAGQEMRVELFITEPGTAKVIAGFGAEIHSASPVDMEDEILGSAGNELSVDINRRFHAYALDTVEKREAADLKREALAYLNQPNGASRAFALFERAIERDPKNIDIAASFAAEMLRPEFLVLAERERQVQAVQRAKAIVTTHIAKFPYQSQLKYADCRLAILAFDVERAVRSCEAAQRILPWSGQVLAERAAALHIAGANERALGLIQIAERFGRHYAGGWFRQYRAGIISLQLHRDREAAEWLKLAAGGNKDYAPTFALLAVAMRRLGDLTEADAALHRFADLGGRKGLIGEQLRVPTRSSLVEPYNAAMTLLADEVDTTFVGFGI